MNPVAEALDWLARGGTVLAVVSWLFVFIGRRLRRHRVQWFFGGDRVEVVLPLRTLDGRAAVAEADFLAGLTLQAFLAKHRITTSFRFIRQHEALHFTSPGTIVICGPKSSDAVARAMSRDPALTFREDARGWGLAPRSGGPTFRSKSDAGGGGSDIGYLSRTVESQGDDRERTVVWIAGVHAPGSAIVAHRISTLRAIRAARRLARSGRFSAVIGGSFTPDPLKVTASQRLFFAVHPQPRRH